MNWEDWIKLAIGNGVAVAIAGWLVQRSLEKLRHELATKTRRADYLRDQIKNAYGPLMYALEVATRSNTLMAKYGKEYERVFIGKRGGDARGEASSVINLMNDYGAEIVKANTDAANILKASWGWLDAEDMSLVGDFLGHVERRQLEHGRDLPFELFHDKDGKLDAPTVYDSRFVDKVRDKLRAKQVELSGPT